jgi:hypothetical protein
MTKLDDDTISSGERHGGYIRLVDDRWREFT